MRKVRIEGLFKPNKVGEDVVVYEGDRLMAEIQGVSLAISIDDTCCVGTIVWLDFAKDAINPPEVVETVEIESICIRAI